MTPASRLLAKLAGIAAHDSLADAAFIQTLRHAADAARALPTPTQAATLQMLQAPAFTCAHLTHAMLDDLADLLTS